MSVGHRRLHPRQLVAFPSDADVIAHTACASIATDDPSGFKAVLAARSQLQSDSRSVVEEFRPGHLDRTLDRCVDAAEVFVKNLFGDVLTNHHWRRMSTLAQIGFDHTSRLTVNVYMNTSQRSSLAVPQMMQAHQIKRFLRTGPKHRCPAVILGRWRLVEDAERKSMTNKLARQRHSDGPRPNDGDVNFL